MTRSPAASEVAGTRERLIAATTRLMCERGLARTSTRDIARAAGVAEGALYHHFADKAELLLAVIQAGMGEFKQVVDSLALQVGRRSLRANLEQVARAALEFHLRVAPMVCSLYSDRTLLLRVRQILERKSSARASPAPRWRLTWRPSSAWAASPPARTRARRPSCCSRDASRLRCASISAAAPRR